LIAWGTPRARWVLTTTILGSGMAMLDGTIVNVALPRIGAEFSASVTDLQWILNGYLLARRYGGPGGRKLAAALALFAAVDVPLVYKSVDWWRTVHPQTTVVPTLDPRMRGAFWASFALVTLVWGILLALRMRLERAHAGLADVELLVEDQMETHQMEMQR
jgi:MFS family permease